MLTVSGASRQLCLWSLRARLMLDSSERRRKCSAPERQPGSAPASATGWLCVLGQASLPLWASVLSLVR